MENGRRTDVGFWDAQWADRRSRSLTQELLHGRDYGPRGTFMRLWRELTGATVPGRSVVELGGAMSRPLIDIAQNDGARVTAVDYAPEAVVQTRALFERAGITGEVVLADMFEWSGGPFDVVTHWGVLEHFTDPVPVLAASARLARTGGLVVFSMPNLGARGTRLWRRFSPANYAAHVFHTDQAIRDACAAVGLTLERSFAAGPPMVRMAPLERGGPLGVAVNAIHVGCCLLGTLAPGMWRHTPESLASYRYFVARR